MPAAFAILEQVAQGLAVAHGHNLVHRDLKPPNIFLCEVPGFAPKVKLLDFGIAKALDSASGVTAPGTNPGTPWYMSPERWSMSSRLGPADDLWSFAVIAFECVTGVRPYEAENLADMLPMLLNHRPRPSEHTGAKLPPAIDGWFLQATSPKVEDRFATAAESCRALAQACGIHTNAFAVQEVSSRTVETLDLNTPNRWTARDAFASTVLEQEGTGSNPRRKVSIAAAATIAVAAAAVGVTSQLRGAEPGRAQPSTVTAVQALEPAAATSSRERDLQPEPQSEARETGLVEEPPAYRAEQLPVLPGPQGLPPAAEASPQKALPGQSKAEGTKADPVVATRSSSAVAAKGAGQLVAKTTADASKTSTDSMTVSKTAGKAKTKKRSHRRKKPAAKKRQAKASRSKTSPGAAKSTPKDESEAKRLKDNRIYHTDL